MLISRLRSLGVLILIFTFLFIGRLNSVVNQHAINPDEAQMAANALRIIRHGAGWLYSDATTSGPLNSLPLITPYLFGFEPTLVSGRIVAIFLLTFSIHLIYKLTNLWLGWYISLILVTPVTLALSLTNVGDFLHYSSELLSVTLSIGAVFLLAKLDYSVKSQHKNEQRIFFIGFISGSLPFAKLQAAPLALALIISLVVYILSLPKMQQVRSFLSLILGVAIIPSLFLLPLIVMSELDQFFVGYLGLANAYLSPPLSIAQLLKLIAVDAWIATLFAWIVLVIFISCIQIIMHTKFCDSSLPFSNQFAIGIFLLPVASLFAVILPGKQFPHYVLLLWAPFLLLAIALIRIATMCSFYNSQMNNIFWSTVLILFLIFSFQTNISNEIQNIMKNKESFSNLNLKRGDLFELFHKSASNESLVWGWMPEWYLISGTYPATRDTMNQFSIIDTTNKKFFRNRLLDDFKKSKPDFVVDAVANGSFAFNDKNIHGIKTFPELSTFIHRDYQEIVADEAACPTIFVRKDIYLTFQREYVKPITVKSNSVDSNPEKLFNLNLLSHKCTSPWITNIQENEPTEIIVEIPRNKVSELWILSAPNSDASVSVTEMQFQQFGGNGIVLRSETVSLLPWPHWSKIKLEEDETDYFKFEINNSLEIPTSLIQIAIKR